MLEKIFGAKSEQREVQKGRFEVEQDGQVAYLEYTITGKILGLIHTEVPEALRGKGIASELTKSALDYARDNGMKVDVVCPSVTDFLTRHREYDDLVMK
jgi:uncharacterized protein